MAFALIKALRVLSAVVLPEAPKPVLLEASITITIFRSIDKLLFVEFVILSVCSSDSAFEIDMKVDNKIKIIVILDSKLPPLNL